MKKFFKFFVFVLLIFSFPSIAKAYDYTIKDYDVNIKVNENNTLDITENITAYFNVPKHGIYRNIPLKNQVVRLDGSTSTNRAKITNIDVDNDYTDSISSGEYIIQIGSEDRKITGEQKYKISYTYDLGKDRVKDYDELYYNIIGSDWDTTIDNVTFTITMPKEFDSSKLGFTKGVYGTVNSNNIIFNVNGNVITGSYSEGLNPNEALTVRLELEEGYFNVGNSIEFIQYLYFLIPFSFLIIVALIMYLYGRDKPVIETVEFYPPEGLNSLETGFFYKGKGTNSDIVSLLIYLANKGYIKITELNEKSPVSKNNDFKLTKIKDYDGNNEYEKIFMQGMFMNSDSVTSADLYNHFYATIDEISFSINSKANKKKIFDMKSLKKRKTIIIMLFISFILSIVIPSSDYMIGDLSLFLIMACIPLIFIVVMITGMNVTSGSGKSISLLPGLLVSGLISIGISVFYLKDVLVYDSIYLLGYIFNLVCIVGILFCLYYIPKRNDYGVEILGKIKGFKNYLETAEKNQLEAMVTKDPTYFYSILPYTYALGVSDKWIEKFETITMQAPNWYYSYNEYSHDNFNHFMNNTMTSANTAMTSHPNNTSSGGSSGGSISSGGGISGGGSGGGGGGSW